MHCHQQNLICLYHIRPKYSVVDSTFHSTGGQGQSMPLATSTGLQWGGVRDYKFLGNTHH